MARAPLLNNRPIIIRRVKKHAGRGHHGGAWKVAYADFVTAMMAFFMLLWLLSQPDKQKLKGLAAYFTPSADGSSAATTLTKLIGDSPGAGGHGRRAQGDSETAVGQPTVESGTAGVARGGTASVPDAAMRVLAEELRIELGNVAAATKMEQARDGLRISLMDTEGRPMFRGGTAELNGYGREMLRMVAQKLERSGAQIAIEGHSDGSGGESDANWRLSGERAFAARSLMVEAGIAPGRFAEVVAMGATQPVYPDQPDRPENRRITIVALAGPSALPTDASFRF